MHSNPVPKTNPAAVQLGLIPQSAHSSISGQHIGKLFQSSTTRALGILGLSVSSNVYFAEIDPIHVSYSGISIVLSGERGGGGGVCGL